ncbi:MAG: DUF177 domain-containing protein [Dehalococcoidia bacterium]
MMRFSVSQELRQPLGAKSVGDFDVAELTLDGSALVGVQGEATLLRTDRGLLVSVRAEATLVAPCSRCLTESRSPLAIEIEEEFIPVVDPVSLRRITASERDECYAIGEDLVLDLEEPIRQYALMAAPIKPLCRPDCAGICPGCGTNLNEGECSCRQQPDERFRALAALRPEEREGS